MNKIFFDNKWFDQNYVVWLIWNKTEDKNCLILLWFSDYVITEVETILAKLSLVIFVLQHTTGWNIFAHHQFKNEGQALSTQYLFDFIDWIMLNFGSYITVWMLTYYFFQFQVRQIVKWTNFCQKLCAVV